MHQDKAWRPHTDRAPWLSGTEAWRRAEKGRLSFFVTSCSRVVGVFKLKLHTLLLQ